MMGGMSVAAAESLFELLLLTFVVLVLTICIFILILKQLGFIKKSIKNQFPLDLDTNYPYLVFCSHTNNPYKNQ